eukprot:gnl/Trimastix_PCT/2680.p1 GENE.gnl/Trimastix_PCT/2680~~gnl/Trimastix_PCT/2680.p1  ORF type:complete len:1221 (-),score=329.69 gnl/Trimastix_PCT/2680:86-3748(-)
MDFTPFLQKLQSRDFLEQADGIDGLFDTWYKNAAVEYAKGKQSPAEMESFANQTTQFLNSVLVLHRPDFLISPVLEGFVVKKITTALSKFARIFKEKPKFSNMLITNQGRTIVDFLQRVGVPQLETAALHDGAPMSNRIDYMGALRDLIQLGASIQAKAPTLYPQFPFMLHVEAIIPIAIQSAQEDSLRRSALTLLSALGNALGTHDVLRQLAAYACDRMLFDEMWPLGILDDAPTLKLLLDRLERASHNPASATLPLEFLASLNQAIRGHTFEVTEERVAPLLRVLEASDRTKSAYKEVEEEHGVGERSQELLDVLSGLLSEHPNCLPFLRLALTPLTLESLVTVVALTDRFTHETWTRFLLPFLRGEIARMQMSGVSGKQLEQEVVNFVRECARIFYINQDRPAPVNLGHDLFAAILEAMRHGYIETERFPAIASVVLSRHINDGAAVWLQGALAPGVCSTRKTHRAVAEIALRLLGVHHTTASADLYTPESDLPTQTVVLRAVSSAPHVSALRVLIELAQQGAMQFLNSPEAVEVSIRTCDGMLDNMIHRRAAQDETLDVILEYLSTIAPSVSQQHAALAFETTLKAVLLAALDPRSTYIDTALVPLLRKVPPDAGLPRHILLEAVRVGGRETRRALCPLAPDALLSDADPIVRADALRALSARPHQVAGLTSSILAACENLGLPDEDTNVGASASLALNAANLARASAPLLALVATQLPSELVRVVRMLVRCARATRPNDVLGDVDPDVERALAHVVLHSSDAVLASFVTTKEGTALLPKLEKLSGAWSDLASRFVDRRILKRVPAGYAPGTASNDQMPLLGDFTPLVPAPEILSSPPLTSPLVPTGMNCTNPLLAQPAAVAPPVITPPILNVTQPAMTAPLVYQEPLVLPAQGQPQTQVQTLATPPPSISSAIFPAQPEPFAEQLLSQLQGTLQRVDHHAALRLCAQIRAQAPRAFADHNVDATLRARVLPGLGTTLPRPLSTPRGPRFNAEDLGRYDETVAVLQEIHELFPRQGEEVLQISLRRATLGYAMVQHFLDQSNPTGARAWLASKALHSPSLSQLIDSWELCAQHSSDPSAAPQVIAQVPTRATSQPALVAPGFAMPIQSPPIPLAVPMPRPAGVTPSAPVAAPPVAAPIVVAPASSTAPQPSKQAQPQAPPQAAPSEVLTQMQRELSPRMSEQGASPSPIWVELKEINRRPRTRKARKPREAVAEAM